VFNVIEERGHNSLGIELRRLLEGYGEVKKITALLSLIKSTKLGAEKLFQRVSYEFGLSRKPRALDGKLLSNEAEDRELFPRIDFNLQSKRCDGWDFRIEAVNESDSSFGLFSARLSEPGIKCFVQSCQSWADGLRLHLYKVYVL